MLDEKMSEFPEVTSLGANVYIPIVDEDGSPKLNQKISKENLILAINGTAWVNGGQLTYADFQAGAEVGGDPKTYEVSLPALPVGSILSAIVLRNDEDLDGGGVTDQNIEVLNDADDFIAGNLLEEWLDGETNQKTQSKQVGYKENSGKLYTTGVTLKVRLTADVNIANLTAGIFTLYYKLEALPIDSES